MSFHTYITVSTAESNPEEKRKLNKALWEAAESNNVAELIRLTTPSSESEEIADIAALGIH